MDSNFGQIVICNGNKSFGLKALLRGWNWLVHRWPWLGYSCLTMDYCIGHIRRIRTYCTRLIRSGCAVQNGLQLILCEHLANFNWQPSAFDYGFNLKVRNQRLRLAFSGPLSGFNMSEVMASHWSLSMKSILGEGLHHYFAHICDTYFEGSLAIPSKKWSWEVTLGSDLRLYHKMHLGSSNRVLALNPYLCFLLLLLWERW